MANQPEESCTEKPSSHQNEKVKWEGEPKKCLKFVIKISTFALQL